VEEDVVKGRIAIIAGFVVSALVAVWGSAVAQKAPRGIDAQRDADARHEAGHAEVCNPLTAMPEPVLTVADFNGNGVVDAQDLMAVIVQVTSGDYIAFFDRNADYQLDVRDVLLTFYELGNTSTGRDRQLAQAFHGTRRYRNLLTALGHGYIPFTPAAQGHGIHYALHPSRREREPGFHPEAPIGLNIDDKGNLWGVFYSIGHERGPEDILTTAPEGFVGEEDEWHSHVGACLLGVNLDRPTYDPAALDFRQCLTREQCAITAQRLGYEHYDWSAKFYLLHAWLYALNPCGTFAVSHPFLMPGAMDPDLAMCTAEELFGAQVAGGKEGGASSAP
jgi:hypothetical protein